MARNVTRFCFYAILFTGVFIILNKVTGGITGGLLSGAERAIGVKGN